MRPAVSRLDALSMSWFLRNTRGEFLVMFCTTWHQYPCNVSLFRFNPTWRILVFPTQVFLCGLRFLSGNMWTIKLPTLGYGLVCEHGLLSNFTNLTHTSFVLLQTWVHIFEQCSGISQTPRPAHSALRKVGTDTYYRKDVGLWPLRQLPVVLCIIMSILGRS